MFNRRFDFLYAAKLALDFVAKARIGGVTTLGGVEISRVCLAERGALVGASANLAPPFTEPQMTTVQTRPSSNPKPVANARATKAAISKTPAKAQSKPSSASKIDGARREAHLSKHDRVLALLSKPDGATMQNMMDATGWQQHSVRGFLAGTVKRKLGLELTSSKAEGQTRRYRIVTRRGR